MEKIKECLSMAWQTISVIAFILSIMLNIWLFSKHESDIYMMDKTAKQQLHEDSITLAYFDKLTNQNK